LEKVYGSITFYLANKSMHDDANPYRRYESHPEEVMVPGNRTRHCDLSFRNGAPEPPADCQLPHRFDERLGR